MKSSEASDYEEILIHIFWKNFFHPFGSYIYNWSFDYHTIFLIEDAQADDNDAYKAKSKWKKNWAFENHVGQMCQKIADT